MKAYKKLKSYLVNGAAHGALAGAAIYGTKVVIDLAYHIDYATPTTYQEVIFLGNLLVGGAVGSIVGALGGGLAKLITDVTEYHQKLEDIASQFHLDQKVSTQKLIESEHAGEEIK